MSELKDLNKPTEIDTTKGKVEPPTPRPQPTISRAKSVDEDNPIFAPTKRIENSVKLSGRTPTYDNLSDIPDTANTEEDSAPEEELPTNAVVEDETETTEEAVAVYETEEEEDNKNPSISVRNDIRPSDTSSMEAFDISSLPTRKAPEAVGVEADLYDDLKGAFDRRMKEDEEIMDNAIKQLDAEESEKEVEALDSADEDEAEISDEDIDLSLKDDNDDDIDEDDDKKYDDIEDDFNLNDVDYEKPTEDEMMEDLRSQAQKHITTVKNKIDLNSFKISDTPISASKVTNFKMADLNLADWVMYDSGCVVSCTGLTGPEMFNLNPENNSARSKINQFKDIYSIIYKHIVNEDKPDFETWMKTTRYSDIDHIYFALYKATYKDSNFMYYECPKCGKITLKDYDFDEMIEYKNDEVKEKVRQIYATSAEPSPIESELYQISEDYVVELKDPTIYSTLEVASLDNKTIDKYEEMIDVLTFVTNIYVIDRENNTLIPIDTHPDKKSIVRTMVRRIGTFAKVIRDLSPDNFIGLRSYISTHYGDSVHDEMTYKIPEYKCEKCGHVFKTNVVGANALLFLRHQLGAFQAI